MTNCKTESGEKAGRASLLAKDESSLWYEAVEEFGPLRAESSSPPLDEWVLEGRRNEAEAALENEATSYEADLGKVCL